MTDKDEQRTKDKRGLQGAPEKNDLPKTGKDRKKMWLFAVILVSIFLILGILFVTFSSDEGDVKATRTYPTAPPYTGKPLTVQTAPSYETLPIAPEHPTETDLEKCTEYYSVDQIKKDPDALRGNCYIIHVVVTQFDTATGKCAFRADFDNVPHTYAYEYKENTVIAAYDDTDCPELSDIDNDDHVKVWGHLTGLHVYETLWGEVAHAPGFVGLKFELTKKE